MEDGGLLRKGVNSSGRTEIHRGHGAVRSKEPVKLRGEVIEAVPRTATSTTSNPAAISCHANSAPGLFIECECAAASIDATAEAAGVGRSTVFTAAGGKPWLLKTASERAVVGDDEQIPLDERSEARELFEMADPDQIVTAYAAILSNALHRAFHQPSELHHRQRRRPRQASTR